jgi:mannosyltransferase OCH1-like enzyme
LYGGIYLDLDYIALKPFDTIILPDDKEVGLLQSNNTKSLMTNSFMVSKPRSKFWLECIEQMKQPKIFWAVTKHLEVFTTTGPFMLNRVAKMYPEIVQKLDNVSVPCDVCELNTCQKDTQYYIIPIQGSSWHSWDSSLMNFLFCNKYSMLALVVVLVILWTLLKFNLLHSNKLVN